MWTSRRPCSWPQRENRGAPRGGARRIRPGEGNHRQTAAEDRGKAPDGSSRAVGQPRACQAVHGQTGNGKPERGRRYLLKARAKPRLPRKPPQGQNRRESVSTEAWKPQKSSLRDNPSTLKVPEQPAYRVRWRSMRLRARTADPYNSGS